MVGIDVAAFWLGLAVVVAAVIWRRKHTEALRHETLRSMMERNQEIDEKLLRDVINPPDTGNEWERGEGRRVLQYLGSLVMIVSPACGIAAGLIAYFEGGNSFELAISVGVTFTMLALIVGFGLFFSTRFLDRPERDDRER